MNKKPRNFINKTSYPGGVAALRKYIDEHLQYPEDAVKNAISGIVSLTFDVDYKGRISNIKIKHGLGFGCDEEAIRLVGMMKYNSTKNRGLYVVFHETMNIHFDLNKHLEKINREQIEKSKKEAETHQQQINISVSFVPNKMDKITPENTTHIINLKFD